MKLTKANIARAFYTVGQFISIGSAFAGSMFSLYDYRYPNQPAPMFPSNYLLIFGPALLAAAMGGFTAYKFQGIKMDGREKKSNIPRTQYSYDLAPRNWKSNLAESIYLVFTGLLTLVYNYFLITGIHATMDNLKNSKNNYPIVPLNFWTGILVLFKTFLIDIPFDKTNSDYEACEEIKEDITGSKAGPLISVLVNPFSKKPFYRPSLAWLKLAGTMSHVLTDYLGLLLSPSALIIGIYRQTPETFWTLVVVGIVTSVPLLFVNYIQALYFEAKISEIALKRLRHKTDDYAEHPLLTQHQRESSFMRRLLQWKPRLKKPIYYGFYTQGLIRGGGDLMPAVLFLRSFFHRQDWSFSAEVGITVPLAIFVFMSSAIGTQKSEVNVAMKHYKKDFHLTNSYHDTTIIRTPSHRSQTCDGVLSPISSNTNPTT